MSNVADSAQPSVISRAEAVAQGLKRYVGKPCRFGHVVRWAANGTCTERDRGRARVRDPVVRRAQAKANREANPEKYRDQRAASWKRNGDKTRPKNRARYAKKRDIESATLATLQAANAAALVARRQALPPMRRVYEACPLKRIEPTYPTPIFGPAEIYGASWVYEACPLKFTGEPLERHWPNARGLEFFLVSFGARTRMSK